MDHVTDRHRLYELEAKQLLDYPWFPRPVRLKILIVTDGSGSFDSAQNFGLGRAITALRSDPWWWVRFDITTAHRGSALSPFEDPTVEHHDNFKFDTPPVNLAEFDQIWLFGVLPAGFSPISAAEIAAITAFMDGGGGVFATGDHAELGASLCSELPRVREMRKWKAGGPAGTPPPQTGLKRHDTLREGPTPGYEFDDQSDAVPQPISPRMYAAWSPFPWLSRRVPHPVLCGRDGVLNVLPDHMHEGEVVKPSSVAGQADWPNGRGPEIIARATVIPHDTDGDPVDGKTFGVLGAYDGHHESIGRIVVDATWHHWFNVNLVGFAAGSPALDKIHNYFWNVGLWLARPATIQAMFNRAVYGVLWTPPLIELTPHVSVEVLGGLARDAIGRRASRCTVTSWLTWRYERRLRELILDPPIPPEPDPPLRGPYLHEEFSLGGIVQRLREEFSPLDPPEKAPDERRLAALIDDGIERGWAAYARFEHDSSERMQRLLARVAKRAE